MRIRDRTWSDYGITRERLGELKNYCRSAIDTSLIEEAAKRANASIEKELVTCLIQGISYSKLTIGGYVPIGLKDFYGYKKYTLAILNDLLLQP